MKIVGRITGLGLIAIALVIGINHVFAQLATCPAPPPGGDHTVGSCVFSNSGTSVNGVDNGNLNVSANTFFEIQNGQTIVFNPTKQINLGSGAEISGFSNTSPASQIKKGYLWMLDFRNGGYPDDLRQVWTSTNVRPATGPGCSSDCNYVRRSSLVDFAGSYSSIRTIIDCYYATMSTDTSRCSDSITGTYAQSSSLDISMNGYVNSNNQGNVEFWARYGTAAPADYEGNQVCNDNFGNSTTHSNTDTGNSTQGFGFNPPSSNFDYGARYYYCFISRNPHGISFGDVANFLTSPRADTASASNISPTSARFNGTVTSKTVSSNAWFRWGSSSQSCGSLPNVTAATTVTAGTNVAYSNTSSLSSGTTYYYCALASNGAKYNPTGLEIVSEGSVTSFTTPYTLTLSSGGNGTVSSSPGGISNCSSTCSADFSPGTGVSLSTNPSGHYRFSHWSGDSDCSDGHVTMNANKSCTAHFVIIQYTLSTSVSPSGGGTVSPTGNNNYNSGTTVNVTASANSNYDFDFWSGACSGSGGCSVYMDNNKSVTGNFKLKQRTLSVTRGGNGSGTVSGSGINCGSDCSENYNHGTSVTLSYSAASGSFFNGWSGDCNSSGQVTMNGDKSCRAEFTLVSSCFLPGTGVLMADGSWKGIEDIKVGDYVMSYDTELGRLIKDRVSKTFVHMDPKQAYIIVNGSMKVTTNHPIWINGSWQEAGELKVGDLLLKSSGEAAAVETIERFAGTSEGLYNLEVEGPNHNFFAEDVLVHNK